MDFRIYSNKINLGTDYYNVLKHYDDFYWAWKPNILEKAMITEGRIRLFEAEDTFLDNMLHNIRAAPIRETPRGPNVAAAYVYKQGKKSIERFYLA